MWPHLWALLGYFALALVVTYPAVARFTSQVPGDLGEECAMSIVDSDQRRRIGRLELTVNLLVSPSRSPPR